MELEIDNLKKSRILLQKVCCHAQGSGFSSSYDCQAKYKEKVPDVSDVPELKFTQLKDLFIKRVQKD